jgi:hypothetical protein
MSGEEVDGDRSDQTELGYERREAPLARHYRTRQRHRHPKPKTLRCLPSPPSVSPPSAPPCASRAAPPSPRCVSRGAPIEDSCHARTLPDVTHRVVPGTRRPRAVRARRTPRDTANAPRHERGVAFARARACSPRAAVAARRSRSASRTNLGFFSRGQEPVSTSKTGGLDRPRDRVESARGRRSPIRTPPAHDAGRSRTVRSRSGTRASDASEAPRTHRPDRPDPIANNASTDHKPRSVSRKPRLFLFRALKTPGRAFFRDVRESETTRR